MIIRLVINHVGLCSSLLSSLTHSSCVRSFTCDICKGCNMDKDEGSMVYVYSDLKLCENCCVDLPSRKTSSFPWESWRGYILYTTSVRLFLDFLALYQRPGSETAKLKDHIRLLNKDVVTLKKMSAINRSN